MPPEGFMVGAEVPQQRGNAHHGGQRWGPGPGRCPPGSPPPGPPWLIPSPTLVGVWQPPALQTAPWPPRTPKCHLQLLHAGRRGSSGSRVPKPAPSPTSTHALGHFGTRGNRGARGQHRCTPRKPWERRSLPLARRRPISSPWSSFRMRDPDLVFEVQGLPGFTWGSSSPNQQRFGCPRGHRPTQSHPLPPHALSPASPRGSFPSVGTPRKGTGASSNATARVPAWGTGTSGRSARCGGPVWGVSHSSRMPRKPELS